MSRQKNLTSSTIFPTAFWTSSVLLTSTTSHIKSHLSISSSASSSGPLTSNTATLTPFRRSISARTLPNPDAPPVMTTTSFSHSTFLCLPYVTLWLIQMQISTTAKNAV